MVGNRLEVPQKTTWQERLSWFAASHIMISLFGFIAGLICLGLAEVFPLYVAFYIGAVVLLLLYVVAGFHAAREHGWSAPVGVKDGFLAFLRPALIAWAWGGSSFNHGLYPANKWTGNAYAHNFGSRSIALVFNRDYFGNERSF